MRLPAYYCPHCKRFKRNNLIDRIDNEFGTYCRGCLTELVSTETELLNMLEKFLEDKTTEMGQNE